MQDTNASLSVSYLEIYNEQVHDLLAPAAASRKGRVAPKRKALKLQVSESSADTSIRNVVTPNSAGVVSYAINKTPSFVSSLRSPLALGLQRHHNCQGTY